MRSGTSRFESDSDSSSIGFQVGFSIWRDLHAGGCHGGLLGFIDGAIGYKSSKIYQTLMNRLHVWHLKM